MRDSTTLSCEPCALRNAGDEVGALTIESIRCQRLLLSLLSGSADAVEEIGKELGACRDCLGRLAGMYLTFAATCLTTICGSEAAAAEAVGQGLLLDIDATHRET